MNSSLLPRIMLLACLALHATPAQAQDAQRRAADSILARNGELRFQFDVRSLEGIHDLTRIVSIDRVDGNIVTAYANTGGFARFLARSIPWRIAPLPALPPSALNKPPASGGVMNFYPTFGQYDSIMRSYPRLYPDLCALDTIGILRSGRMLLALRLSRNVSQRENEPRVLYTSSMHGNETSGFVLMLDFIDYLLARYPGDPRVARLLDGMELWINPLANPDGTYAQGDSTVAHARRFNANAVDLNRNYRDPENGDHPDGNEWQEETRAFMRLADSVRFTFALNFHDGSELVNYPWDTWPRPHPDNDWWAAVARMYADTVHAHSAAGYFTDLQNGITNGYAWYEVNGGRQDFMNYFHQCREATVEISAAQLVDPSELPRLWESQYRSFLGAAEHALFGLRGIVTDSLTGQPIAASVLIPGHDADGSGAATEPPIGDYHRLLAPGSYTIEYSAPGYVSKTFPDVRVSMDSLRVLDARLMPVKPVAGFVTDDSVTCSGAVQFTDASTASVTSWSWDFGDGDTSAERDPSHRYARSATYTVTLRVANAAGADTLVRTGCVRVDLPAAPAPVAAERCGPGPVTLACHGSGLIGWYASAGASAPAWFGDAITLPYIDRDTVLHVADFILTPALHAGKMDSLGTGGYYGFSNTHYEIFNSAVEFTLVSVLVHANGAGPRTFFLRDAAGGPLQEATLEVPDGRSRVALNFRIPAGAGMQLGVTGGNNLFRNTGGAAYPYVLPGLFSITGNSAGDPEFWYFLYDWELQRPPCISERVPVTAKIRSLPPHAAFRVTLNGAEAQFTDESTEVGGRTWHFGDGDTSNAVNPLHAYAVPGAYRVVLVVRNACGEDSAVSTQKVTSVDAGVVPTADRIDVAPNPARDGATIEIRVAAACRAEIRLLDLLGRVVAKRETALVPGRNLCAFGFNGAVSGVYVLHVQLTGGGIDRPPLARSVVIY